MTRVADLDGETVREALRLLGEADPPANRQAARRVLREHLAAPGAVGDVLDGAPEGAREAFVELCDAGVRSVEELLGRGWWGRGTLPPPLDWLQRRGLVAAGDDGLVRPVEEARAGHRQGALDLPEPDGKPGAGVRVDDAAAVVVADVPELLDRAIAVPAAQLRAVAPTVAVSPRTPGSVSSALRAAGVPLAADTAVTADPDAPALPAAAEDAVTPRAIRAVLERGVVERRQLRLQYYASSRGGAATERVVDPWRFADDLLVGWCHLREGERTFAVDRIGRARLLAETLEHEPG